MRKLVKISIAIHPDLLARLDRIADAHGKSRSATISGLLADVVESAEQQAKFVGDPTIMSAFHKAFSAPGVLAALGKAMSEEIDAKKAGEVLEFFKSAGSTQKRGKKRGGK